MLYTAMFMKTCGLVAAEELLSTAKVLSKAFSSSSGTVLLDFGCNFIQRHEDFKCCVGIFLMFNLELFIQYKSSAKLESG